MKKRDEQYDRKQQKGEAQHEKQRPRARFVMTSILGKEQHKAQEKRQRDKNNLRLFSAKTSEQLEGREPAC